MSDANANNQDTTLSAMPPAGSSSGLDPEQRLAPRRVVGAKNQTLQPTQQDIVAIPNDQNAFNYTGQNLVDSKGIIVRPQYSATYDEAYQELAKLDAAQRKAFLKSLQKVGVYDGSSPSNDGFDTRDFAAVARAMLFANTKGVTLDVAVPLMATEIGTVAPSGPRIRTTAAQDLRQVFKQATQSVLGRDVGDAEVDKFVRAYQGMEVREQTGGAAAPSPQVAAVEQVEESFQEEAGAMGMLQLSNAFSQALKGLG
jgi:hypothetical protein